MLIRKVTLLLATTLLVATGCKGSEGKVDTGSVVDAKAVVDSSAADQMTHPPTDLSGADLMLVDAGPVTCTLGTMYPNAKVIDPDNPDWAGDGMTKDQIKQIFAKEKASNTQAYRAYKAAHTYPQLLPCAFCACGCAGTVGHKSAVDCFKDFHGFS